MATSSDHGEDQCCSSISKTITASGRFPNSSFRCPDCDRHYCDLANLSHHYNEKHDVQPFFKHINDSKVCNKEEDYDCSDPEYKIIWHCQVKLLIKCECGQLFRNDLYWKQHYEKEHDSNAFKPKEGCLCSTCCQKREKAEMRKRKNPPTPPPPSSPGSPMCWHMWPKKGCCA